GLDKQDVRLTVPVAANPHLVTGGDHSPRLPCRDLHSQLPTKILQDQLVKDCRRRQEFQASIRAFGEMICRQQEVLLLISLALWREESCDLPRRFQFGGHWLNFRPPSPFLKAGRHGQGHREGSSVRSTEKSGNHLVVAGVPLPNRPCSA